MVTAERRREESFLYFAYGANMSGKIMRERCPAARPLGPACLHGYELVFSLPSKRWGGFVADVRPAAGRCVWGVLWELGPEDLARLDVIEGVSAGRYRRERVAVTWHGRRVTAECYRVDSPLGLGSPSPVYRQVLVEGAREHDLPESYVRHLEGAATEQQSDGGRDP